MDLVGKAISLDEGWLYTETIDSGNESEKIVLVKLVVMPRTTVNINFGDRRSYLQVGVSRFHIRGD